MLYFQKNCLLFVFLILVFLFGQGASMGFDRTKCIDLSILPPGFQVSSYNQILASIGLWNGNDGYEVMSGTDIFSHSSTRFKYMKAYNNSNYWGIGLEYTNAKVSDSIGLGSTVLATYNETAVYLSLGIENPLFFDWLLYDLEGGYILSFVNNFSGDYSKYPHSRPYASFSFKFRFFL